MRCILALPSGSTLTPDQCFTLTHGCRNRRSGLVPLDESIQPRIDALPSTREGLISLADDVLHWYLVNDAHAIVVPTGCGPFVAALLRSIAESWQREDAEDYLGPVPQILSLNCL